MPRSTSVPAEPLLHPVAIGALLALIVNDHVLKSAVGGPFTGKLSDVAGLVIFPLVLAGLWEVACWIAGRRSSPLRAVMVADIVTAVGFSIVKLDQGAADMAAQAMAAAQSVLLSLPLPLEVGSSLAPGRLIADASDLVALPALLVPLIIVHRVGREG
jgi:hypothetical protein